MPPTSLHLPLSAPLPPPSPPSSPPTATAALSPSAKVGSLSPPSPGWEDIPRSFMSDSPPPDDSIPTTSTPVATEDNATPVPTPTPNGPPVLRITVPEKTIQAEPELDDFVDPATAEGLYFDDESLSKLERIYLFSRSRTVFHRIFISRTLTSYLPEVTPSDAVEYVLPLLNGLGTDPDEAVKEAFVAELVSIMMWFYTNCQVVDDDVADTPSDPPLLPVQAFTPLLGSLLLSQNGLISQTARVGVVDLLGRFNSSESDNERFGLAERKLLEQELILGVVIGMARLDLPDDELYPQPSTDPPTEATSTNMENDSSQNIAPIPAVAPDITPAPEPPSPYLTDADVFQDSDAHDPFSSWVPPSPNPGSEPSFGKAPFPEDDGWLRAEAGESMFEDYDAGEEATLGRVASMSLVAAVTANGLANSETQKIFVEELKRVGRDSVYWVRREAAFALGALAKVVPFEVVLSSLVPLFESFVHDTVWHVRNSALYALPPVLAQLKPDHRRALALNTLTLLASDPSQTVRSGLLEVLGEAIHEFRDDEGGPPTELIQLFIGDEAAKYHEHEEQLKEKQGDDEQPWLVNSSPGVGFLAQPFTGASKAGLHTQTASADSSPLSAVFASSSSLIVPDSGFIRDPERALICAFNIPAVTLTLGVGRWNELREYYKYLASDRAPKVRRTLAASLGAMAKILGPDYARKDLLDVFWDNIRASDSDVRHRAVDCLADFMEALGPEERGEIEKGLDDIWTNELKGWRERETFAKLLPGLAKSLDMGGKVAQVILMKALLDNVAAVREAAISVVPAVSKVYEGRDTVLRALRQDLDSLASADKYRRRATFVACSLAILNDEELGLMEVKRTGLWERLAVLKDDSIVDVRIGVSRLIGLICEKFYPDPSSRPAPVSNLVMHLGKDTSMEVRSYVIFLLSPGSPPTTTTPLQTPTVHRFATFSRPPHHQTSFFEPPSPYEDSFRAHSPFLETDPDPFSHHPPPLDEPTASTDNEIGAAPKEANTRSGSANRSSFIDHENDSDEDLEGEIDLDDLDDDPMMDEPSPAAFPLPPAPGREVTASNQAESSSTAEPPILENRRPSLRDMPPHQIGLGLSYAGTIPLEASDFGQPAATSPVEPAAQPPIEQGASETRSKSPPLPGVSHPTLEQHSAPQPLNDVQLADTESDVGQKASSLSESATASSLSKSPTKTSQESTLVAQEYVAGSKDGSSSGAQSKAPGSHDAVVKLPFTQVDPSTTEARGSVPSLFQVDTGPSERLKTLYDGPPDSLLLRPRIKEGAILKLAPPPKGRQAEASLPLQAPQPPASNDPNSNDEKTPQAELVNTTQLPVQTPPTPVTPQAASMGYLPEHSAPEPQTIDLAFPDPNQVIETEELKSVSLSEQVTPLSPSSPKKRPSPTLSSVHSPRSFQQPPLKGIPAQPVVVEHHAANVPLPMSPSDEYHQFEARTPSSASSASPAPSSQGDSIFSPTTLPLDLRSPTPDDSPTLTTPPPNGKADGQDVSDDERLEFRGREGGLQVPEEDVYPTPTLEHPFYPGLGFSSKPHAPSRAQLLTNGNPEESGPTPATTPSDPSGDERSAKGETDHSSVSRTFEREDGGYNDEPFNTFVSQRKTSDKTIVRAIA